MPLAPDDPRHGTRSAYQRHGCRCDDCRQAEREYQQQRRASPRGLATDDPKHGTYAGYKQGCRCAPCKAAEKAYRMSRPLEGRHGMYGYQHGCRCDVCRAAMRDYHVNYRATRGHW